MKSHESCREAMKEIGLYRTVKSSGTEALTARKTVKLSNLQVIPSNQTGKTLSEWFDVAHGIEQLDVTQK